MTQATTPERGGLTAAGICVHYAGVRAVDGVDLSLRQGEIVGLIGPNGAGKSTTLNAISGFVSLTAGRLTIDDHDVTGWAPQRLVRHGLARTFQEKATFPQLTVFENVELGALGAGMGRRAARRRAGQLLDMLALSHHGQQLASALPHGDERRVGIARAVAVQPRFLLMDEPAAGLDDDESHQLIGTLSQLRDELGCGILLVEHDLRIIFTACERIHVLDHGKPIAAGSPDAISTDRRVIEAYLGEKGANLVAGR